MNASATFSHTHSHTVQTHTRAEETADWTPIPPSVTPPPPPQIAVNKRGQHGGRGERLGERGEKKRGSGGSVWETQMGQAE